MNKEHIEAMKARISELIETGKSKGVLTYKEVVELLGDIELDPEQFNRILDTLSSLNIEVIKDEPVPEADLSNEPEEEELEATSDDEKTAPEEEDEQDEQPAAPEQKMHQGELTSILPASNT